MIDNCNEQHPRIPESKRLTLYIKIRLDKPSGVEVEVLLAVVNRHRQAGSRRRRCQERPEALSGPGAPS